MRESLKNIVNEAIQQETDYKKTLDENRRAAEQAKLETFNGYNDLEKHFGGILQVIGYAFQQDDKRNELSLSIQGFEETPSILLKVSTTRGAGYIGFQPSDKDDVYKLIIDEKFFGTNLTDKISQRIKAVDTEFSPEEAQKAMGVLIATQSKKFQRDVKFALSWGKFMPSKFLPVWNEKYNCKNADLTAYSKPVTSSNMTGWRGTGYDK